MGGKAARGRGRPREGCTELAVVRSPAFAVVRLMESRSPSLFRFIKYYQEQRNIFAKVQSLANL